ncbi:MAG: thiamine pyrophosphate-dependent enzyme, partial [Acidimicrobiia bacterium]|nr:thiamine pyrophosphate-dependent enzyme [Acidimicrobiia bacterium]
VDGMDPLAVLSVTTAAVEKARSGGGPTLIEAITYRYGPHATADDPSLYRDPAEVESWRAKDPVARLRRHLERRNAPVDVGGIETEAADEAEKAIRLLEERPLPDRADAVRHTYVRVPQLLADQLTASLRGNGLPPDGLEDSELWTVGEDVIPDGPTTRMNMAEAITAGLDQAMTKYPEAVILGEDVGKVGGVFRITEGLQVKYGPDRVMDTPLNESGIVGTAIGMAIAGGRPIAEIQFDGFVYPAFDQIVSHLGRMRYRGRGTVSLPVVVRMPNGAGIRAHEHHCDSPEALFAHVPGLVVVVPSTPVDAKGLLAAAVESDDPVMFLEPKVMYRTAREEVPVESYTLPIGRARIRQVGTDATIVTYGAMVPKALEAAASVGDEAKVEVIDLRTIYPWDRSTVLASVEKTGRLLLVQEPPRTAGIAAEIAATVAEEALYSLQAPIMRVCGFDAPIPHFAVEEHGIVSVDQVRAALRELLSY